MYRVNQKITIKPLSEINAANVSHPCMAVATYLEMAKEHCDQIGFIYKIDSFMPTCISIVSNPILDLDSKPKLDKFWIPPPYYWVDVKWIMPFKTKPLFIGLCDECGGINQHENDGCGEHKRLAR